MSESYLGFKHARAFPNFYGTLEAYLDAIHHNNGDANFKFDRSHKNSRHVQSLPIMNG